MKNALCDLCSRFQEDTVPVLGTVLCTKCLASSEEALAVVIGGIEKAAAENRLGAGTASSIKAMVAKGSSFNLTATLVERHQPGSSETKWNRDSIGALLARAVELGSPAPIGSPADRLRRALEGPREFQWFNLEWGGVVLEGRLIESPGSAPDELRMSRGKAPLLFPISVVEDLRTVVSEFADQAAEVIRGERGDQPLSVSRGPFELNLVIQTGHRRSLGLRHNDPKLGPGVLDIPLEVVPDFLDAINMPVPNKVQSTTAAPTGEQRGARPEPGTASPKAPANRDGILGVPAGRISGSQEKPSAFHMKTFVWTWVIASALTVLAVSTRRGGYVHALDVAASVLISGPFWGAVLALIVGVIQRSAQGMSRP